MKIMHKAKNTVRLIFLYTLAIILIHQQGFGQINENTILLDEKQTTKLALANNFDIQIYNIDKGISEQDLLKSYSVYDTEVTGEYKYDEDQLARSTTITGKRNTTVSQDINFKKKLPTGTILSLGAAQERDYTDSAFATLKAFHESTGTVSVTQPLGRDFLGAQTRNTVRLAQLDKEDADYTSSEKIEQAIALAQKAYWRLVLAYHETGVRDQILTSAQRLYDVTKKNYELGAVEIAELFAAEANLKERQQDLLLSQNKLNACTNDLRFKLNLPKTIDIIPKDRPEISDHAFDFNKSLTTAIEKRMDYRVAKNKVSAKKIALQIKRNSLWPQIDFVGTLKKNGIDGKFRKSFKEVTSEDNPEYIFALEFNFPFENTSARAEFKQAQLEQIKSLVNLKKSECAIFIQVNDAVNYCAASKEAARYQSEAMRLQENKYRAEDDRFNKGRSDIDRLIRYQQDYLTAQIKFLNSVFAYNEAIIDLKLATAELLSEVEG